MCLDGGTTPSRIFLVGQDLCFFRGEFFIGEYTGGAKFAELLELCQLVVGRINGRHQYRGFHHRCQGCRGLLNALGGSVLGGKTKLLLALYAPHNRTGNGRAACCFEKSHVIISFSKSQLNHLSKRV